MIAKFERENVTATLSRANAGETRTANQMKGLMTMFAITLIAFTARASEPVALHCHAHR
jgi:hypothetical protein